jgi:magnesium transporter
MLAVFLTMLTGTGGNAGNQSSALVIRGLSNGEINSSNYHRVVLREMLASSGIALVLAAISLVRVLATPGASAMVALVISATTFLTVVGAVTGGTVVPLLLERMGVDPVHISSPVLATLTDVVGVLLLCLISSKFLLTAPL